ncbi:DUF1822 family protein [Leptothoe sp. PORK10 BA2]|uniref:DUF1822 family protein n=1 Tax=Leptothoe sp. PORK10 BA2 TaxID=3110254 RepID=UPI002B20800B|nr:DUF1822 family protein [Leptothoe sp. PORK10 BA2]MEA5463439.1 DUF1822 family protein [Leptothoe sp. PORK10 BA2]
MSVLFDNPVQPVLEMPADTARWQSGATMADAAARWRIYLHQLGLTTLMAWCQAEFSDPVLPWPHAAPFDIWHVVDGLALQLGNTRIVVMLSEAIQATELQVPQEWVDLPGWSADYYLAAHINVDDGQLVLWGYATYVQLKHHGTYNVAEQTYCLKDTDLIQDFSVFWVAQQLAQSTHLPADALPDLPNDEAKSLIQSLAHVPEPRLALPLSQWGALLQNDHWRQQLYQQRHNLFSVSVENWLNGIFAQGWQPIEALHPQPLASCSFRSVTDGSAVLTCGKKILLNNTLDELLLMFSVDIETNKRRNIRIQLHSAGESLLPNNLILALKLSETGELLKTVKAGIKDDFIQIPSFRCLAGQRLRVHIQLADSVCQEEFIS